MITPPYGYLPNINGLIKNTDTVLYKPIDARGQVTSIIITNKDSSDIQFNLYIVMGTVKTSLIPEGQFILKSKHTFIWDIPLVLGQGDSIVANATINNMLTYSLAPIQFV